ncbi:MAG: lipid IV(A) 3-deoxy-D-manno-octulosonic acid transferase [Steroidobacteraceae bacterium]|nr:lipid IV(A) 3-deoxy-D-manno-octulosonic acid transferase [Steroidobacteraceae bacterium]
MRLVYVLLVYLLAPVVIAMEAWKAAWNPEYRGRLGQRLGRVGPEPPEPCLWVHGVSVGEVQAAAALIQELRKLSPDMPVVVTTVTPTGAQRARALFGDTVFHCYLPYDLPGAVRRFLDRTRPRVAIIMETEIWPTLYHALGMRGIPLVMASARVSTRSVDRYRRMASLFRTTLSHGILIGAQTAADADRFRAIGAAPDRVRVTGNVKFDMEIPATSIAAGRAFRACHAAGRPVWIAGSTHEGEEEAAIAAHARVLARHPDALLILVPRHPQRFDSVRALLRKRNVEFASRSTGEEPAPRQSLFLVDTLGELQMFYAAADVAFVAGSLVPIGGHSLLEPAVLGLPMLSGPHNHNAQDVADLFEQCGALRIVRSREELAQRICNWFDDPARARADGERGRLAVTQSRGAVTRLVAMVAPLLSLPAGPVPGPGAPPATSSASSGSR